MPILHPVTHTFMAIGCHARYQSARQKEVVAQGGIEPATLRLPDDSFYLLSHIAPLISHQGLSACMHGIPVEINHINQNVFPYDINSSPR